MYRSKEWGDKLTAVISTPVEGLICVDQGQEKGESREMLEEKERQQDFYIQQLQQDIATMTGELFGRNGSGGFTGEVRDGLKEIKNSQTTLQKSINCLEREISNNKIETEGQIDSLRGSITSAHARLDTVEEKLVVLEDEPGTRSQAAVHWIIKTVSYFVISGGLILLALGAQKWLGT